MKPPRRRSVRVTVDEETFGLLALLGKSCDWPSRRARAIGAGEEVPPAERAQRVVEHLIHSAMDGVRRPGAWERGWVVQAFGDNWADELEPTPDAPWRMRLRAAAQVDPHAGTVEVRPLGGDDIDAADRCEGCGNSRDEHLIPGCRCSGFVEAAR